MLAWRGARLLDKWIALWEPTRYAVDPPIPSMARDTRVPVVLSASANIASSGENTTAQLTAPAGKTTSNFTTGRAQDDENPSDAINIADNFYTELEWSLISPVAAAAGTKVYQFRVVLADGTPFATYSVTPQWTIVNSGWVLAKTEANDTLVGTATVSVGLALTKTEATDSIVATGTSPGAGSLVITSITLSASAVNLTAQNFDGWAVLDNTASPPTPTDYKTGTAGTEIVFAQSGAWNPYTPDPRTISWTNGHNTSSSSTVGSQLTTSGVGQYHTATFPANTLNTEYTFYAGIYSGTGRVTVSVSDGSSSNQVDSTTITGSAGAFSDVAVVVTGHAASTGQTITIKVEALTDAGSVLPYAQAAGYKVVASSDISAVLAATEAADTVVGTTTEAIAIALASTEANDSVVAAVTLPEVMAVAVTEAGDTIFSTQSASIFGFAMITEANDTAVVTATLPEVMAVAVTEANDTVIAHVPGLVNPVSRSLPTYATSGTAANATSANYNNILTSSGTPQRISIDISSLSDAQKTSMALYWYNDASTWYFDFDAGRKGPGGTLTDIPAGYTIEANTAAGGSVPGSGWSTLATVTSNTYVEGKHTLNLAGKNWVSMNISSSSNTNVQLKLDLYDTSAGNNDWAFYGDSRFKFQFGHNDPGSVPCDSFGNLVAAGVYGRNVPQLNCGMAGFKIADVAANISTWLAARPGVKNIVFGPGVNDATAGGWASQQSTDYTAMITAAQATGANVFLETIGDSTDSFTHGNVVDINSHLAAIITATGCYAGYDRYTAWHNNQSYINPTDNLHMTDAGLVWDRTASAAFYGAWLAAQAIAAAVVVTEANDTVVAAVVLPEVLALASTEGNDSVVSTVVGADIAIAVSITEATDMVLSTATENVSISLTSTEGGDMVVAVTTESIAIAASMAESSDTLLAAAALPEGVVLVSTEANDSVIAAATQAIAGVVSVVEANDTVVAIAIESIAIAASMAESSDVLTATTALPEVINAALTEANDSLSSTQSVSSRGAVAITEADDTVVAGTTESIAIAASIAESNDTLVGLSVLPEVASVAVTEGNDTLAAAVALLEAINASNVEGDDSLVATGTLPALGTNMVLSSTEGTDAVVATAVEMTGATLSMVEGVDTSIVTLQMTVAVSLSSVETADQLTATNASSIAISSVITELNDMLAAFSGQPIEVQLAILEGDDLLHSTGHLIIPSSGEVVLFAVDVSAFAQSTIEVSSPAPFTSLVS